MLGVYGIYDIKAYTFSVPFFGMSDAAAVRSFSDLVKDRRSSVSMHPEDYQLFQLGEFDEPSGRLWPLDKNKFLCSGSEFAPPPIDQYKLFPDEADVSMSATTEGREVTS